MKSRMSKVVVLWIGLMLCGQYRGFADEPSGRNIDRPEKESVRRQEERREESGGKAQKGNEGEQDESFGSRFFRFFSRRPASPAPFRPPAVPLVACDPYFSVWSAADRLTDVWPAHWTGRVHAMQSMIRVDGRVYRLMGPQPAEVPPLPQTSLRVLPTRTIYEFRGGEVMVSLTFTTPQLPGNLDVFSLPVTWLTWEVRAVDGREHDVEFYFDVTGELVVNVPEQQVTWARPLVAGLTVMRMGTADQRILATKGDDVRIDWGYLYVSVSQVQPHQAVVGDADRMRRLFARGRPLPVHDDARHPRPARDQWPAMVVTLPAGRIGGRAVSRHLTLAYDDIFSIEYMGRRLPPYWRRSGLDAAGLLLTAEREYPRLVQACETFDRALIDACTWAGGPQYAQIAALAYRQCNAANKLTAGPTGQPMMFPKENFSNGCIGTVDVIYPMIPQYLLFNPELARAALRPVLEYAASPRWRFPFAPHDLGTYPLANGQVYGGGETSERDQMPVEETGNMLIMMAAIARIDGRAEFARQHWPLMTRWAEYLREKGFDPEHQLCTDDFAGHLARNVNLSAKAILGLGAYAQLCRMEGRRAEADAYRALAEQYVRQWIAMADDGECFRLAFDRKGTWSQKYNLVWDRVLGLNLFPSSVVEKELRFYRRVQNRYGLPLDSRETYTKLDWILWTASMAPTQSEFQAFIGPVYAFLHDTPDRVPMTDWYRTTDARQVGFQARPVVGGVFMRLLTDRNTWRSWAYRGE